MDTKKITQMMVGITNVFRNFKSCNYKRRRRWIGSRGRRKYQAKVTKRTVV